MATQKDRIRNRKLRAYGMIAIAVLLVVAIIILVVSAISGPGGKKPATSATPTATAVTTTKPAENTTQAVTDNPTDQVTDNPTNSATNRPTNSPTQGTTTPPANLTEGGYGVTNVTGLNFRKDANTSAEIIRKLDKGVVVTVVSLSQGDGTWAKIQAGDDTGFVKTEYLKPSTKKPNCIVNVQESMNVRKGPSATSEKVAVLGKDAPVTIIRFVDSEWVQIKMSDGNTGYAMLKYLKEA